jgi:hypothetical protein
VTDAAATDFALLTQEDDVEIEEEGEGGVEDAMRQLTSGRLSMNGRVGAAGAGAGGGGLGASGRGDGSQSMKQHRGWGLLKGLMGKGAGGGGQVATSSPVANRDGAGGMATGSPSGQSSQAGQQQRLKKLGLVVSQHAWWSWIKARSLCSSMLPNAVVTEYMHLHITIQRDSLLNILLVVL